MKSEIKHIDGLVEELKDTLKHIEHLKEIAQIRLSLEWDNFRFIPILDETNNFQVIGYDLWEMIDNKPFLKKHYGELREVVQNVECAKEYINGTRAILDNYRVKLSKITPNPLSSQEVRDGVVEMLKSKIEEFSNG